MASCELANALTTSYRSLLAVRLLRGIHLVVELGHGLLKILGCPHRGGCRDARRDEVLCVWEARRLEGHRVQ